MIIKICKRSFLNFYVLYKFFREKESFSVTSRTRDADFDRLEQEIQQLTSERDQLVRQLEKSQDMLLSFQQDLNLTENELKRVAGENKRLKDESEKSERGVLESKEKEIRSLNDRIRAMEYDYDDALQKHAREKMKADKAERDVTSLQNKIDQLEAESRARRKESMGAAAGAADTAKFEMEIARLSKERDTARTELEVCRRDLDRVESELARTREELARLREESSRASENLEKGSRETLQAKDNEIRKLTDRVSALETEVRDLTREKESLESQRNELEKSIKANGAVDETLLAEKEKRINELTEQIRVNTVLVIVVCSCYYCVAVSDDRCCYCCTT